MQTLTDADNLVAAGNALLQTLQPALKGVGHTVKVLPAGVLKVLCQLLAHGGLVDVLTTVLLGGNSCSASALRT